MERCSFEQRLAAVGEYLQGRGSSRGIGKTLRTCLKRRLYKSKNHEDALVSIGAIIESPNLYKHLSGEMNLKIMANLILRTGALLEDDRICFLEGNDKS